jgi:LuxR family maltose regulon positive regulatory protein
MAELLRQARRSGIYPDYAGRLLSAFDAGVPGLTVRGLLPEPLSDRELEVLRLVAAGASNKEIAVALFIALPTVKKHMGHILVKLDTHNRVQAITRARELGLLL